MLCNYYIACGCRNDSPPLGFLQPFLCHFSCSTSYLVFNVGADLSMFPSCFPGVFYFQCLIVLAVAYFGKITPNTAGFLFLIKCFMWGGHFSYKDIILRSLNVLSFSYACGLNPCSSRVLLGRQMNRLCSWMKLVLIPLATCPLKHLDPTLQQSPGGQRPALMAVLWRQKLCH